MKLQLLDGETSYVHTVEFEKEPTADEVDAVLTELRKTAPPTVPLEVNLPFEVKHAIGLMQDPNVSDDLRREAVNQPVVSEWLNTFKRGGNNLTPFTSEALKAKYAAEKKSLQREALAQKALIGTLGLGEKTYYTAAHMDVTGLGKAQLEQEGYTPLPPILSSEDVKSAAATPKEMVEQALGIPPTAPDPTIEGIKEGLAEMGSSFTDPTLMAGMVAGVAEPTVIARMYSLQSAASIPLTTEALLNSKGEKETAKNAVVALGSVGIPFAIERGIAKVEQRPVVAPTTGKSLNMPEGAKPPEGVPATLESPVRENGGMTSIVLKDGTALVGGKIHAQTYDAAVQLGYNPNDISSGVAGFTRPDGTSWDLQGNPIAVKKVVDLSKPSESPSGKTGETPDISQTTGAAPEEIGKGVEAATSAQPPAMSQGAPPVKVGQVAEAGVKAPEELRKEILRSANERDMADSMREGEAVGNTLSVDAPERQAHGAGSLKALEQILTQFDKGKSFYTGPLTRERTNTGADVRLNSPFVVVGFPNRLIKSTADIAGVLVSDHYAPSIPSLEKLFPGVKFVEASKAEALVKGPAPVRAPEMTAEAVEKAIRNGEPVPSEVLAQHPEVVEKIRTEKARSKSSSSLVQELYDNPEATRADYDAVVSRMTDAEKAKYAPVLGSVLRRLEKAEASVERTAVPVVVEPAKPSVPQEITELVAADVKADPRLDEAGVTRAAKPNSLVVQLRDLDSNPIREVVVKSSGDPLKDSQKVQRIIKNAANESSRVSVRESSAVTTGPNGRAVLHFSESPNGMVWTEMAKLIEARQKARPTPVEDVVSQATQSVIEGGMIEGLKNDGSKDGHYVVIPPEMKGDAPMAIGPFVDKAAAQTFLDAEVGAKGAKVVNVTKNTQKQIAKTAETPAAADIGQGPGARTYQPPNQPPESYSGTALKNAVAELERVSYGMTPADPTVKKAMIIEWLNSERTLAKDPNAGNKLVMDLMIDPSKRLTDAESALLLRHKASIENLMNDMAEQSVTAKDPVAKARAQALYDGYSNQLLDLLNIAKEQGTQWGREGKWRQMFAAQDMSLSTLVTNRRAKLGRNLTEVERAEVEGIAKRYAELTKQHEERVAAIQKELDAAQAREIAAQARADAAKAALDAERKAMPQPHVVAVADSLVQMWDQRAEAARGRLREKMTRMSAGLDPTVVVDVAEIAISHIVHVGRDFTAWSAKMIQEYGPKIQAYLDEGWKRAQEIEAADKAANQKTTGATTTPVTPVSPKAGKTAPQAAVKAQAGNVLTAVNNRLAKAAAANKPFSIATDARRLARHFYLQGVTDPLPLVDAVHGVINQHFPGITKREVMDAISGYGSYRTLSKDATEVALRDLRGQLQQIGKLDDMAKGIAPSKTGMERRTPSDAERRLIQQVNEAKKAGGYTVTDPETQLRTSLDAAKRRLENQIKDLEDAIATNQKLVKTRRKLNHDQQLGELIAKRDVLREQYDDVFKDPDLTPEQQLAKWKEHTLERIKDYEMRIAYGDFKVKPKKPPVKMDKQALEIEFKLDQVHTRLMDMRMKDELAQRSKARKIIGGIANVIRFSRAAMTGGEFSGVMRQGAILGASHPIIGTKALVPMFKALMSERAQFEKMREIRTDEAYPLSKQAELDLTDIGGRLRTMEEHYMFRVSDKVRKVWGIAHGVKFLEAFQRAYTTYLNTVRFDAFKAMTDAYGTDLATAKAAANYINVATGRGSKSVGRFAGPGLNTVLFAPRYTISRFQYLAGQPLWSADAGARKMIMAEYVRTLGAAATVYSLAAMAGAEVELDPRATDFGKIKIGDTRIDPMAGLAQATRLLAQEATGWRKTQKGNLSPIRDTNKMFPQSRPYGQDKVPFSGKNGWEVVADFTRNKLSPSVGAAVSLAAGKDTVGQPVDLSITLINMVYPITYGDIYDSLTKNGIPAGSAYSVLALFGMGVQNYSDNNRAKSRP